MDLSTVEMPARVAALPRDHRGYPIAASVEIKDGVPADFTITDPYVWMRFVQERRCGVCGQFLGAYKIFVGGALSIANRLFYDLGMHRDCAEYALRVCPYLAAPRFAHRRSVPEGTTVLKGASDKRPDVFGLGVTKSYLPVQAGEDVVVRAFPWVEPIVWWQHGQPGAEEPENYRHYMAEIDKATAEGKSVVHMKEDA